MSGRLTVTMFELRLREILFPDVRFSYRPGARFLGWFPSNHKFVYAVPKVLSGKRYSFPVWFGGFAKRHASVMRLNANGKKPHCLRELV